MTNKVMLRYAGMVILTLAVSGCVKGCSGSISVSGLPWSDNNDAKKECENCYNECEKNANQWLCKQGCASSQACKKQ
ncbi:hypothetical protein [Caballeronia sp. AZ7_KS35]|uniref:hypothetical protein n=1 Tax=Caballeronia sp. AZ7_KS35 TaxID=2921762 RepID=UPI00202871DC|nr:hypothetical protein [Caballeronia sp. AZ7_KS35]